MTDVATVSAPVQGGRGRPFGMPGAADVAAHGYVMEEHLACGVAARLETAEGPAAPDGLWATKQVDARPFTTRLVVIRPEDPGRFNGVVVVNWQNVTCGVDLGMPPAREIWRGYAWVGVTAQEVALTGYDGTVGLPSWDPARYASLIHPGDSYSYAIFTAVARAVGPERPREPVDPMGGLDVTQLLATGGSQSAMRLASYINGAHQHERLFDAFFLTVHWGYAPPPDESPLEMTDAGEVIGTYRIRDDQSVPIFVLNSETEAWSMFPVRQPDTSTFRFWEVAGGAHGGGEFNVETDALRREQVPLLRSNRPADANTVDWSYVQDAALRHVRRWVGEGVPPPKFDPIEIDRYECGPRDAIRRGKLGIACGGVMLPEVGVPVAVQVGWNTTPDPTLRMSGACRPLSEQQLSEMYLDAADYQQQYAAATLAAADCGIVLRDDLDLLLSRGRNLAAQVDAPSESVND